MSVRWGVDGMGERKQTGALKKKVDAADLVNTLGAQGGIRCVARKSDNARDGDQAHYSGPHGEQADELNCSRNITV